MTQRRRRVRDAVVGKAVLALLGRVPGRGEAEQPPEPGVPPPNIERELPSSAAAERGVIVALLLAALAAGAFIVFYVVLPDDQLLGLSIGGSLVLLAVACILAGKKVVPQETTVEEREDFGDRETQEEAKAIVRRAGEGVSRRRLIVGAAGAAGTTVGAAALFPLASLGPAVGDRLHQSPWRPGRAVVDADGAPLTVDDIEFGGFRTGFPEGATRDELGSPVIIVRLPEAEIELPPDERTGIPSGVIAFSKICPHAGCAISMYRHPLYEPVEPKPALVCPCHYSTFDVRRGGELIFGPAGRSLPRLPLRAGDGGELIAEGDYLEAYGPSWRGVRQERDDA